jgi:hypothetical protein
MAVLVAGCLVLPVAGTATASPATGFVQPFSGTERCERLSAVQATDPAQLNVPLGQMRADRIARELRIYKSRAFTPKQYRLFITGRGVRGNLQKAKLVDQSVKLFTNTIGRPIYANVDGTLTPTVLASYGLMVSRDGYLQSLANAVSPSREVNKELIPRFGYVSRWARANGASGTMRMLYASAYPREVRFGSDSQQITGPAQLVLNRKGDVETTVGMSMVPSIWLVNFILTYCLSPQLAAKMPAYWTPIPERVAKALSESPDGRVRFSDHQGDFPYFPPS